MSEMSRDYIEAHRAGIHTADSWGRAIVELIFNDVEKRMGKGGSEIQVEAAFKVTAYEPRGCVQICAVINGVQVCYHVNT